MNLRLKRIEPITAAVVFAVFDGLIGLLAAAFYLLEAVAGHQPSVGLGMAIASPVLYAVGGFFGGLIGAALYNLAAHWTGGLELELSANKVPSRRKPIVADDYPATDDFQSAEPIQCLQCGATIPAGTAKCVQCGWSYNPLA